MRKIIITLFFALVGISLTYSQNDIGPALSSQLFSRINFNPAGIGNNEKINIFSMNRLQWAGFDGAPKYTLLNIHYFNEGMKSGFGGVFSYDQLGIANKTINAKFAYCYNLDLWDGGLLSLGASGGMLKKGNDFSLSSGHIYTPEAGMAVAESQTNPDFDFGLEFSTQYLLIGASVDHIGYMDPATTLAPTQTYYGYIRGMFPINQEIALAPSILYMNSGVTNVVDINAVAFYNKMFWGGLSFRPGAALSAMVGLEWQWLRFGYSYEMSLGSATINSNTHEIMLSFIIPTSSDKQVKKKKKR